MANLTENTQYNKTGTQSPLANLSSLQKTLQQTAAKKSTSTVQSALMNHYSPETFSRVFGTGSAPKAQDNTGFPINQPIAPQQEGSRFEPLPEGYSQFVPADEAGNWADPTDKAQLRNWPADMGGGQYIVDPTQPGKMIKSARSIMEKDVNPGAKQKILGKLSPRLYQVDHNIPLWLGGSDTLANLEILDNVTHRQKTAVQSVALTLLANKKINLNEAKTMALMWKDKDAAGLPSAAELDKLGGYVPLGVAEKYAQKWKEGPSMWKFFPEAFKENMQKLGNSIPVVGEFAKGLVGGGTAGMVPGTGPNEETGAVGAASNIAGNVVGTITGLGLLSKGLGWGLRGAKGMLGMKKAVSIADEVMKINKLTTDVGKMSSVASKARLETLKKMSESAGLLSLWGQIGLTGREATGQQDAEMKNHVSQFLTDVAFGTLLGSAKQSVRGYATVGLGSTAFSLMEGEEIVPALQNGALMTALHGMGYKKGLIDPKIRLGNEEAYKMSASTFNRYLGDIVPTVKKGQKIPEILTLDIPTIESKRIEYQKQYPNDPRLQKPITNEGEALDFMERVARKQLSNEVVNSNGAVSQEQFKKELTRIVVARNQLYNQTLTPELRIQKEWNDLYSMGEKLRPQIKSEQVRGSTNSTQLLADVPTSFPNQVFENPKGLKFPTGNVPTTGYGDNIDVVSKQTITDLYNNPQKYGDKVFIVKDPETTSFMRLLEQEQIAAGKKPDVGNPDDALRVFVKTIEGETKPIGYMPRTESFDIKKNNLNKTYHEITGRIRNTIESSKTPEELKKRLNKDKSQITIDDATAQRLFDNKGALKTMADEELYSILKPTNAFEKFSSDLNNSAISVEMDKNGLNVLIVDKSKILPVGGSQPRRDPSNPFISLNLNEQDWLRSIEMRDGNLRASSPIEKGISNIVSKQNSQNMAKTAGNVMEKVIPVEPPVQPALPIAETPPATPVLAPKLPQEAVPAPTTAKMPDLSKNPLKTSSYKPDIVDEFFSDMVDRIESSKSLNIGSASSHEKSMMEIVNGFKRKNPGMPEADFRNAMNDAKGRATAYVQNFIDNHYKGTKIFGSDNEYSRTPKSENKNVLIKRYKELKNKEKGSGIEGDVGVTLKPFELTEMKDIEVKIKQHVELDKKTAEIKAKGTLTDAEKTKLNNLNKQRFTLTQDYRGGRDSSMVLANKFGLELQPPNEAGISYLKLDRAGNPTFSEEFKKANSITSRTPMDYWGSFLGDEMKVYKGVLSKNSKDWYEGIQGMKKAKSPYAKGFASAIDEALKEKFDVKNKSGETIHGWQDSWKLNSNLKNLKDWFDISNEEGYARSQPFRRTAAITAGKNYAEISKSVAKADAITRQISEKARMERLDRQSLSNSDVSTYEGLRVKERNQIENVSEDLSPFDMMTNGLLSSDVRKNLISRYNTLRRDLNSYSAKSNPQLIEQLQLLFAQIKKLSVNIPEETKTWKLGSKIQLKNNGEPTLQEGINDGLRVVANILKKGKTSPGFINFEKIKQRVKDAETPKPDGEGGLLSDTWGGIKNMFTGTVKYEAPTPPPVVTPKTYDVRGIKVSDPDIKEAADILYGEVSNRTSDKQQFETRHIINTAINRAVNDPKYYGGSLVKVLQRPMQYQSYAPEGITVKGGNVVESQYQKAKAGNFTEDEKKKYQIILDALNELKTGKFQDTTGGKTFYVHASDGTLWLGATPSEAKKNANQHEKQINGQITPWGTSIGAPKQTLAQAVVKP